MRTPKIGSRWRHYKGGVYVIADIGIDASRHDDGKSIWYYNEDQPDQKYHRPLVEWHNEVEYEGEVLPRFKEIQPKGATPYGAIKGIFGSHHSNKGNRPKYSRSRI